MGYTPKKVVIDLYPAWNEVVSDIFSDVSLQLCILHFERVVVRTILRRTMTMKL